MFNDCIQTITAEYQNLTKSEKKIADYLIGNLEEALQLSILELRDKVNVSEATIVRTCRKFGYTGYRDFCIKMSQKLSYQDDYVMDLREGNDTLEIEIGRVLMASMQAIKQTSEGLDYNALAAAADAITQCRSLLFYGTGTSGIVCQDAVLKFLRVNKPALYYADYHTAVVAVSNFSEKDVVIGISHSGKTRETCDILESAKKNGAKTIAITTYPHEPIGQPADIVLTTITRESPLHKIAITSRTSQLAIIDALFVACVKHNYTNSMDSVLRVSQHINSMNQQAEES